MRGDEDKQLYVLTLLGTVIVLGVFVGIYLMNSGEAPATKAAPKVNVADIVQSPPCNEVFRVCNVRIEANVTECTEAGARPEVMAHFATPEARAQCAERELELAADCAPGCQIDYQSLITVSGQVMFDLDSKRDESGRCKYSGSREITMKASCVPVPLLSK